MAKAYTPTVKIARASNFAQAILSLKGKPLSFDRYMPWKTIYDVMPKFMLLIAGRQIGKSVSLGGRAVTQSVVKSHFNSLYVTPFQEQAKRFSKAYLDPFMDSPLVRKHFKMKGLQSNVLEKVFSSGSRIYLSYAQDERDADRIRGIMADQLMYDEVQDVVIPALPAIFETMSASEYGYKILSGTAKSTSNTIELLWQTTCKFEWVMKCDHCNYYNIPDTYANCLKICANPEGPSCIRCGKVIDVTKGQWIATRPHMKDDIGFHLPQFIMSANTSKNKWPSMFQKVKQAQNYGIYSPAKLSNEVFGISTDLAGRALSVRDAMDCCNPLIASYYDSTPQNKYNYIIMGVDWSVSSSTQSFTVASVFGFKSDGKMELLYAEKFQGIDILAQVDRMEKLFHQYNCSLIASDRGVGVVQVQTLQRRLGFKKVIPINYVSSKVSVSWNSKSFFLAADRTRAIDDVVMKIKQGIDRFETPCYELTKNIWKDALNIYEEETSVHTRVYRHHPEEPDDWIHSCVFAYLGYRYLTGDYTFKDETGKGTHDVYDPFEDMGIAEGRSSRLIYPDSVDNYDNHDPFGDEYNDRSPW